MRLNCAADVLPLPRLSSASAPTGNPAHVEASNARLCAGPAPKKKKKAVRRLVKSRLSSSSQCPQRPSVSESMFAGRLRIRPDRANGGRHRHRTVPVFVAGIPTNGDIPTLEVHPRRSALRQGLKMKRPGPYTHEPPSASTADGT